RPTSHSPQKIRQTPVSSSQSAFFPSATSAAQRRKLVGSGAGAVIRRRLLGCIQRFRLRARLGVAVIRFPAPATSHAACGFPALRGTTHSPSKHRQRICPLVKSLLAPVPLCFVFSRLADA